MSDRFLHKNWQEMNDTDEGCRKAAESEREEQAEMEFSLGSCMFWAWASKRERENVAQNSCRNCMHSLIFLSSPSFFHFFNYFFFIFVSLILYLKNSFKNKTDKINTTLKIKT